MPRPPFISGLTCLFWQHPWIIGLIISHIIVGKRFSYSFVMQSARRNAVALGMGGGAGIKSTCWESTSGAVAYNSGKGWPVWVAQGRHARSVFVCNSSYKKRQQFISMLSWPVFALKSGRFWGHTLSMTMIPHPDTLGTIALENARPG